MTKRFKLSADPVERSRSYFILEGVTGIGQFSLTTGAFLAGFIEMMGGSEQINGFIAVIPAIAGVFQLFSSMIFERVENRKKTILMFDVVFRLILSLVYFVPILLIPTGISLPVFIGMYFVAYSLNALLSPVIANWMVQVTPLQIRGRYLAKREKISLTITGILTIGLGQVLDFAKTSKFIYIGFIVVGMVLLIKGLLNIFAIYNIQEVDTDRVRKNVNIKDALTKPFKSNTFRRIMYFSAFWNFALQVGGPFISVYMVTRLNLSYTYMMGMSVITIIVRVLVTGYWGRLADKKSWFLTTKLSIGLLGLLHISWGFVTLDNYMILIPILNVAGGICWGGIGISMFNLQFLFANKEERTTFIGTNAALGGLLSFFAVKIGGQITEILENTGVHFWALAFNNMQTVFVISGLCLLLCPVIVKFFIESRAHEMEVD